MTAQKEGRKEGRRSSRLQLLVSPRLYEATAFDRHQLRFNGIANALLGSYYLRTDQATAMKSRLNEIAAESAKLEAEQQSIHVRLDALESAKEHEKARENAEDGFRGDVRRRMANAQERRAVYEPRHWSAWLAGRAKGHPVARDRLRQIIHEETGVKVE